MTDVMDLTGTTIALLATDGFEDSELTQPLEAVKNAGASIDVIADKSGSIVGKNGTEISVDETIDDVSAEDYDGLLLPGGLANPDVMRMNADAIVFIQAFFREHKPVAAICHAPWLLAEADVLKGRTVTSWPSLRTDLVNAGAHWVDEEVVVDAGLVTSRNPSDLEAFCAKAIEELGEGKHEAQTP